MLLGAASRRRTNSGSSRPPPRSPRYWSAIAPPRVPVTPGPAAAVGPPALDAVGAAPRGALVELHLVGGRVRGEEGAVVGQRHRPLRLDLVDGRREGHLAEAAVVAVRLAVGRAVDELRPIGPGGQRGVEPRDGGHA